MKTDTRLPDEQGFRFQHGALARSLDEFHEALAHAPPETVWYHREHYVPWLRDIVQDLPLARRLAGYAAAPPAPDVYREIVVDLVARRREELGRLSPPGNAQR